MSDCHQAEGSAAWLVCRIFVRREATNRVPSSLAAFASHQIHVSTSTDPPALPRRQFHRRSSCQAGALSGSSSSAATFFGRRGPLGQFLDEHFGIVFAFRWTGAALACAVMGFPLMVRAIRLSIEAVDRRLEDAAATLGAAPIWVFLVITLPLTLPGIIAGMILSFARSMGEFGATITFVSNIPGETQTLPSLIYTLTQIPGGDAGALRLT